jgi:hypothetical protein
VDPTYQSSSTLRRRPARSRQSPTPSDHDSTLNPNPRPKPTPSIKPPQAQPLSSLLFLFETLPIWWNQSSKFRTPADIATWFRPLRWARAPLPSLNLFLFLWRARWYPFLAQSCSKPSTTTSLEDYWRCVGLQPSFSSVTGSNRRCRSCSRDRLTPLNTVVHLPSSRNPRSLAGDHHLAAPRRDLTRNLNPRWASPPLCFWPSDLDPAARIDHLNRIGMGRSGASDLL